MRQVINGLEPAVTSLNLELDPVERIVLDGLAQRHQRVLGFPFLWTTSSDSIQTLKRMFGNERVKYPYGTLMLKSWTLSKERGSLTAAGRRGSICSITTDQKRFYRLLYLPVDFEVQVVVKSNSFANILRAANSVLFGGTNGWFKFSAAYGGISFEIAVNVADSLSLPEVASDSEEPKEYLLDFTETVQGFISYPTLLEGQIVDTLEEVVDLSPNGDPLNTQNERLWVRTLTTGSTSLLFSDLPANLR
jgi:hypothetical protein